MNSIESAQKWTLRGVLFLLPVFFLPITSDFFVFNKLALLAVGTSAVLLFWVCSMIKGEFKVRVTPFDLPVLAFALSVLISAIIVTPNKMDAFIFPGTASIVIFSTLLYFAVVQYIRQSGDSASLTLSLLIGSALAAIVSLGATVGIIAIAAKAIGAPAWLTQNTFNTTGGLLEALTLFVAVLPMAVVDGLSTKEAKGSIVNAVLLIAIVLGLASTAYYAMPGKPTSPRVLPLSSGWSITLETLKQNALLGVGPGNYVEAFNRFRTVDYNTTSVWNLRFGNSSNWIFEIWTVSGLLGVATFLWIMFKIARRTQKSNLLPVHYSLLATIVLFLLLPANILLLAVFYLLLAVVAAEEANEVTFQFTAHGIRQIGMDGRKTNILSLFMALLIIAGAGYGIVFGRKVYAAEISYQKALASASQNDGKATYDSLIETINQNPSVDRYRITYSQVNLALANNIASKKDLTDQDRQVITQLIQQAIREGQAAVSLNAGHAQNWENLARIYQSLFSLAQGADQWTISAYQQSVALDPVNPLTRLSLGGVYYALNQKEDAVKAFELAVASKPDFANAHYNLAVTLRDKGDTLRAAQEMAQTLNLVTPGTPDYEGAKKELDALQKKLTDEASASAKVAGAKTQSQQPALQAPSPAPKQVVQPPIQLPENGAPPSAQGTPQGEAPAQQPVQ